MKLEQYAAYEYLEEALDYLEELYSRHSDKSMLERFLKYRAIQNGTSEYRKTDDISSQEFIDKLFEHNIPEHFEIRFVFKELESRSFTEIKSNERLADELAQLVWDSSGLCDIYMNRRFVW